MPELLNPGGAEFWVGVGLLVFFGLLIFLKVPRALAGTLDARAQRIQSELDEAQRLRQEAEALLATLREERAQTERQAAEMLAAAEAEARRLEEEARVRLEEQIARRAALADRRIALAEQQAAQDVKAAAAELAARAAEAVLAQRLEGAASDPLVDRAVEQLATRLR
jgi:F-type H+-transporting ATPase subunit b